MPRTWVSQGTGVYITRNTTGLGPLHTCQRPSPLSFPRARRRAHLPGTGESRARAESGE